MHVADYGSAYTGSFIPLLRSAIAATRGAGWEAAALFAEEARGRGWLEELEADGVDVRFLPRDRRIAAQRLRDVVAGIDGTVILQSHFSRFDVPCVVAAAGRPGTFAVWHEHSELSADAAIVLRNAARFAVLGRRVDRFLCVAPHIGEQVIRRGAPRERVLFFPNPVDAGRFPLVTAAERREARSRLGLDDDARVVLHFSWDWRRKGGDLFLRAIARLERDGLVAVLVDAGPEATRLAGELGVSDCVRVLPPREHHTELYAAADVFVSCSRREGMPFAVAEALSRGLGVVATDLPGHRALGDGLAARRLAPPDPAPIAAEIALLLARDAAQVAEDGGAAHAWVRANLDPGSWSARLLGVYADVLARAS